MAFLHKEDEHVLVVQTCWNFHSLCVNRLLRSQRSSSACFNDSNNCGGDDLVSVFHLAPRAREAMVSIYCHGRLDRGGVPNHSLMETKKTSTHVEVFNISSKL
jgi:hypothetical protein